MNYYPSLSPSLLLGSSAPWGLTFGAPGIPKNPSIFFFVHNWVDTIGQHSAHAWWSYIT